jgi:hypothetical protein
MTRINSLGLFCVAALLGQAAWCQAGISGGPTPTDPDSMAGGGLPGAYPISVTAANVNARPEPNSILGGSGSDNLLVTVFPDNTSSQPFKWTESRHNEGDISLLIGPSNPSDPAYLPPPGHQNFAATPGSPQTLAWRLSRATGASLVTVRHNGVDNGDTFGGFGPVGTIHGVAYFNFTGAAGWGFRMDDGIYANGLGASTDLQMGVAGFDSNQGEAGFNTAVAYFPYEQGWVGAWVNPGMDGEATFANSSPNLPTSSVNYTGTTAFVKLPDVDSDTDGMLFVAPTDDDNLTNIAAAFPNNDGWTVSVREDDNDVFSGDQSSLVAGDQNDFQFLYVPYAAQGLIGGHVEGATGTMLQSAGDQRFTLTRTGAGEYALSINGPGPSKLGENDGMLILSVAGAAPDAPTLADRKFMSYQYDPGSGNFLIESRELVAVNQPMPPSENQFRDELALRDVNFYFAWVDFLNPLAPPPTALPGDYNGDGSVDAADYVVWRKGDGSDEGYNDWRTNFGHTAGSGSGALADAAVPEPASLALCAMILILRCARVPARFGAHQASSAAASASSVTFVGRIMKYSAVTKSAIAPAMIGARALASLAVTRPTIMIALTNTPRAGTMIGTSNAPTGSSLRSLRKTSAELTTMNENKSNSAVAEAS